MIIEGLYGYFSNSMALLADAGHNLSDVLGLLVAWTAFMLANRKPTAKFTYGLGKSSILAALFNAVFLLMAVGIIYWEAFQRLFSPQPVAGTTVMVVAAIGIVINGLTAWMFARGQHTDLNLRGAYLHMLADAAVSLGVVIAGLAILFTGWNWLDPVISILIATLIVLTTWGLLRDSLNLSLAAVPNSVDAAAVRTYLTALPGVTGIHDLHIWPLSTTQTALTCHLVMPGTKTSDTFLHDLRKALMDNHSIHHATIQIEQSETGLCHDCASH